MKLVEKMKRNRIGNKGFTLIEMIIVIGIMAVLLGIVGTQVTPYLDRVNEESDMQIINSFATAAVTFYSLHSEEFDNVIAPLERTHKNIWIRFSGDKFECRRPVDGLTTNCLDDFKELVGYDNITDLKNAMSSVEGKKVDGIDILYNFEDYAISGTLPSGALYVRFLTWHPENNDGRGVLLDEVQARFRSPY